MSSLPNQTYIPATIAMTKSKPSRFLSEDDASPPLANRIILAERMPTGKSDIARPKGVSTVEVEGGEGPRR